MKDVEWARAVDAHQRQAEEAVALPPTDAPTPRTAPAVTALITPDPTAVPATAVPTPAPEPVQTDAPAPRAPAAVDPPAATNSPAPPSPPEPTGEPGGLRHDYSDAILVLINQRRADGGLGVVSPEGALISAAEAYAAMHFKGYDAYHLDHWLDGGPGDRAWARGYCCSVGEILVTAEGSPEAMVQLWMDSPGHHDIIMNGAYDDIGIACFQGPYPYPSGSSQPILCSASFGDSR